MIQFKNPILVTGVAGFIGFSLTKKLLLDGHNIVGIDNLNSYYDKSLKLSRLAELKKFIKKGLNSFEFYEISIEDNKKINDLFNTYRFSKVIHLAAQAGVRYSISNPYAYFQSNLVGFGNILESIRKNKVSNFIFASSSSVYGGNRKLPFMELDNVDHPISLYAATKKSNELMAHSYSHLYDIPTTGLRFFTVYGPWGRPDMAPMIFTKSILENKKIKIFNNGKLRRDFTFIDDIVEGIFRCSYKPAESSKKKGKYSTTAPFKVFNIGCGKPTELMDFIKVLEQKLEKVAEKEFLPMQQGDVLETWANTDALENWINFSPKTSIEDGVDTFIEWYIDYYKSEK